MGKRTGHSRRRPNQEVLRPASRGHQGHMHKYPRRYGTNSMATNGTTKIVILPHPGGVTLIRNSIGADGTLHLNTVFARYDNPDITLLWTTYAPLTDGSFDVVHRSITMPHVPENDDNSASDNAESGSSVEEQQQHQHQQAPPSTPSSGTMLY